MNSTNVTIWLAFLAGLASFLSPCVLALVPIYIGYLSGRAAGDEYSHSDRWVTLFHGLAFVCGFSLVFIFFNIVAASLGLLLGQFQYWLAKIGGIVVVIFGIHLTGLYRIPWLDFERKINRPVPKRFSLVTSFLFGIFFSAGWIPCVGPILGWIMTFSLNGGSIIKGTVFGVAYSLGMAIPFLFAALGVGWVTVILRKYSRVMRITEVVMGTIIILAGLLLFFDSFSFISRVLPGFTPGL
jgi:cytochrome c-type biogenesis protein